MKHWYSHYKIISTCEGYSFKPQPMQILTTRATKCWHINQLHEHQNYATSTIHWASQQIPQHSSSHINMHFSNIALQKLGLNTIFGTPPLEIHHIEPRGDRVHLSRLRCEHHTALATYRKRIVGSVGEVCINSNTSPQSLTHIKSHCPTLKYIRAQHNIRSPLDLWHFSANSLFFHREVDLQKLFAEIIAETIYFLYIGLYTKEFGNLSTGRINLLTLLKLVLGS